MGKKKSLNYKFRYADAAELLRINPPTEEEKKFHIKKLDPCDVAAEYPGGFRQFFKDQLSTQKVFSLFKDPYPISTIKTLIRENPSLRDPIIEGVMRRGETMNIIAPPKKGKSWMTGNLVMAFASGGKWFEKFQVTRGRTLIFDNELHKETIAFRYKLLGDMLGIEQSIWEQMIHVVPLRGKGIDIYGIHNYLKTIKPGDYSLCILDSFYRFMPKGLNENDNASMTELYNTIDGYAETYDLSFALIHHTSKGGQGNKGVTDVGSGAGAQSRACDVHLVLRDHEDDGITAIDVAVRSFEPVAPFCVRFKFPRFDLAESYDPEALKGKDGQRGGASRSREREDADKDKKAQLLAAIKQPTSKDGIVRLAETIGLSGKSPSSIKRLIDEWTRDNKLIISEAQKGKNPATWVNPIAAAQASESGQQSPSEALPDGLDGVIEIPSVSNDEGGDSATISPMEEASDSTAEGVIEDYEVPNDENPWIAED